MAKAKLLTHVAVLASLVGCIGVACSFQRGATQQSLARAQGAQAQGFKVYEETCMICHGEKGEGGPGAPSIMGPGALPVRIMQRRDTTIDREPANSPRRRAYEQSLVPGSGERQLRIPFKTAQDIYVYLTEKHPPMNASLELEQYWAVLSFVLDAHGVKVPQGGLTEANAAQVLNERE
jgi:cytochrome c5